MRAASLVCGVVALIVCAWFALGARQAIDTQRASAIASAGTTATAPQEREVSSLVRAARLLNPDKLPDVLLGRVELEHRDYARARRVLESVVRSEPQDIQAWLWLAGAWAGHPALALRALRQLHRLDPRVR